MKRLILFVFSIALYAVVQAQPSPGIIIKGTVTDAGSKKPLEYATVTLFIKGNQKPLTGTVTDKSGAFVLNDLQEGNYTIVFECIGYTPFSKDQLIVDKTHPVIDEGPVSLIQKKSSLEGVTVVSQSKLVVNKIDKMVFNAEKDLSSQSGVATDVLKKVPQVSVDVDGNVELAGSGGVRFLINGKPSTAFGSNITDVLQSIPASQIKSIEVITNPGAKYDAQGLGGIINIILKTSNAKGYNGNLSLTAGTRIENGSFNINLRNNNFGVNAFVSGNQRLRSDNPFSADRFTKDGSSFDQLHQSGVNNFERHGVQAGLGFDWTLKKLNSITGNISFNQFGNSGHAYTDEYLLLNSGSGIPVFKRINITNNFSFKNADIGLNYKRTFAKEGRELEFGLNNSFGNERNRSSTAQLSEPQDSLSYGTQSTNPGKTGETEITLDYTEPFTKDVTLGLGSKASFYDINSNAAVLAYQPVLYNYAPESSLSNNLSYHQKVYALYSELSFPLFAGIDAKTGLRYERTEISSYFSNAQHQAQVPGYNTFVPSLYLSKKFGESNTVKLSYSKRIERPDYRELNPFVNTNDPKNLSAGNPYLLPEIGHRIELAYSKDFGKAGSAMVSLFYRINDNDIQPYIVYYPTYNVGDSVYTNVSVSTRQNIGMEKNMGMNLFGDLHVNSKLGFRSNIFFFRRHTINKLDAGYNSNSFNYRFNLNANYQFASTLVAEFFGNFNSARNEAQGKYPSFTTYSFAIRKQFWNKKGSIALTANNFFSKYVHQKTVLTGPGFSVNGERQIPFRSVGINFAWKFGKLEFKKQKPEADNNLNPPGE